MNDLMAARLGVQDVQARYTDAVWRGDPDAFANCFAENAEWRISGRVFRGREEIRSGISVIMANFIHVLITFRVPIVSIGETGIAARTYIDERCAWKNGDTNIAIGRYYDRFVEDGDRLLFKWRLFELHYRGAPDMTGTFFDHPDYGPPPAMPPLDALTEDMASKRWGLPASGTQGGG
ncbi:MAG: nuclear transport factor 2 family protein [Novosphingobium sp.]|nr:nuclear transport factor 2 family protein [Novosphingobium sp.]